MWYCGQCTNLIYDESESPIVCDSCLNWYHFQCVNNSNNPPKKVEIVMKSTERLDFLL